MAPMAAEQKANMKAANEAANSAKRKLILNHQEEYSNLLGDERVSRGLLRVADGGTDPARLQARKERLEAQIRELNAKLGITSTD